VNPNNLATNLGNNPQLLDTAGGGYVAVEYLFIQFAGFTFGKSSSAYSTPWNGFPGNINSSLLGGNNTDTGVNNIQYTAQFGNGVSGTIGLDDPTVWNRTAVYNLSIPLAIGANETGSNAYAGVHSPDIVGNIRVDQAWGLFQLSAAAHEVNGSYNTLGAGAVPTNLSEVSGHPNTKWGGSAKGAFCAAFAASHPGQAVVGNTAGAYTCNPDFNVSQLGVVTRWTPVKNLTFSA
jgi:Porin subfamily